MVLDDMSRSTDRLVEYLASADDDLDCLQIVICLTSLASRQSQVAAQLLTRLSSGLFDDF